MKQPVIFIVGPTGSGKTAVSLEVAQRINGEIICADSRTVYKNLDVGTAKPTQEEQAPVPHWGLDVIEADQAFSAHQFKELALDAIKDIHRRGKVPIVTGGTGLYIDTLLYDLPLGPKADPEFRKKLEIFSVTELHGIITERQLDMPQNYLNKRHLIRTIERNGSKPLRNQKMPQSIVVGITTNKDELMDRLTTRAAAMFSDAELMHEAEQAAQAYGWEAPGLSGNIYRLLRLMLEGQLTQPEAVQKFITLDWQLAKRQLTWFRRKPDIVWLEREKVLSYILETVDK